MFERHDISTRLQTWRLRHRVAILQLLSMVDIVGWRVGSRIWSFNQINSNLQSWSLRTIEHHRRLNITAPSNPTSPSNQPSIRRFFVQKQYRHPTKPKPKKQPTHQPQPLWSKPCQEPTTAPSTPTSCATETLNRRHHLLLSTAYHAIHSSPSQATNGAGVLCAGAPNSAWSSGGASTIGRR